jgi:hypothetical protein
VLSTAAVFDGTVISSRPFIDRSGEYWYVLEEWTFQIHRTWTANVENQVLVRAYPHNCGVWFEEGERAIVVAIPRERANALGAFKCDYPRTALDIVNAEVELGRALRRDTRPADTRRVRSLQNAVRRSVLDHAASTRNWIIRSGLHKRGDERVTGWAVVTCLLSGSLAVLLYRHHRRYKRNRRATKRAG